MDLNQSITTTLLCTAPFFRIMIHNSYWLCTILDSYWSWLVSWLNTRLIHMIDSYELWLRTIPVVYKASLIRSRTLVSSRLIPCTSVLALEYDPFLPRTLLNRCYYSGGRRSTYRIVRSVTSTGYYSFQLFSETKYYLLFAYCACGLRRPAKLGAKASQRRPYLFAVIYVYIMWWFQLEREWRESRL